MFKKMIFWFIIIIIGFVHMEAAMTSRNKVLLVSFDGFRWDYLRKPLQLPTFRSFSKAGTSAEYIVNNFPTSTFPSHITISTGLFSESHGIVGNTIYDPSLNQTFEPSCSECQTNPIWFAGGEPIWITATKNNIRSGTMFWPGSETTYNGLRQEKWMSFNLSISMNTRINYVVDWLKNGIDLATLYLEEPDITGHNYGPDSPEVDQILITMDGVLKRLIDSLQAANLLTITNIILTADHGMVLTPPEKYILLANKLNRTLVDRVVDDGVILMLNAKPGKADDLHKHLNALKDELGHMTVWRKQDIPDKMHYKLNNRITDFVVIGDEGYLVLSERSAYSRKATHGFHNMYPSMWPFFMARGPNIRSNFITEPFKQEDIYIMIANLLGIPPSPNNGSFERVKSFVLPNDGVLQSSIKFMNMCSTILMIILINSFVF